MLDAFGFQRIIIETVGVGQSELAIVGSADTSVLMLVPESGDAVQVLKAGVMEIADLYVVNKADRPGADRLVHEVEVMLGFRQGRTYRHTTPHHLPAPSAAAREAEAAVAQEEGAWIPTVLTTVATRGKGVDELLDALERHHAHLEATERLDAIRRERLARHTKEVVDRALHTLVWEERGGEELLAARLDAVVAGRASPYKVAAEIVAALQQGTNDER